MARQTVNHTVNDMIYLVDIEDQDDVRVDLEEAKRGRWRATVGDDRDIELELLGRDDDGAFVVSIDGVTRRFHLDKNCTRFLLGEGDEVSRLNVDHAADVVLEHEHLTAENTAVQLELLESPITGIVLDVLVDEGDDVDKGDPTLVVEAMKMENTLTAPASGTIGELMVEPGDTVYSGDPLLKVD